ncbi:hypothetical protein MHU86_2670 [Fragilaria crotonensis]|nr:hypothetical protein MHU86_2670 [Fragilaria crotonensis]
MALTISPLASCQPFLVVYMGAQDHYRALGHIMVANQLDQGVANASLSSNIQDIRENAKLLRMPRDLHQVSLLLQQFAVLLTHALFQGPGTPNPFVRCLWLLSCAFHERLLFGAAPSAHGHTMMGRGIPHTRAQTRAGHRARVSAGAAVGRGRLCHCGVGTRVARFPQTAARLVMGLIPHVGVVAATSGLSDGRTATRGSNSARCSLCIVQGRDYQS